MSANDGGKYDGGFQLVEMVEAQRGFSDLEFEIFLATGQKPDLSKPPLEYADETPDDAQIMSEDDAAVWLSGGTLTASAFYDYSSSHSVSPLYEEVVRPKVEAFRFDPKQLRDPNTGRWVDDLIPNLGKLGTSTKKSTPASIYKKHTDGAIISQSKSGDKRMRWDGGKKKFVVEKQQDSKWTEESTLAKGAAYNEMKKPDTWYEPVETDEPDIPTARTPTPTAPKAPEPVAAPTAESTAASTNKIKPSAIYGKYNDGDTVAQSADGTTRMRWDAERKKFIVESRKDGEWTEESALTKGAAYNDVKNPDKWFEPTETSTENEPSSPSLAPEPDLVDTELSEEKAPEAPAIPEAEKVTSEETPQGDYPTPTPVPEVDPDWPFSFEPFQEPQMDYGHLVRPNDDAYANDPNHDYELKTLPVSTIVPSQENDYEEWGDGLENDMTGKPLAIQKDGSLYLMDGHHRTAKAGENGTIQAWVLDLDKPKTENGAKIASGLQKQAVDSYRIGGYTAVNRQLRTGQKQKLISMDTDDLIKGLDEAMDANVTTEDQYVWRGLNVSPGDLSVGAVLEDKAFLSTSRDRIQAEHFAFSPPDINAIGEHTPVLMNVKVPVGSKALDFGGGEQEVLLDRGAKLKITSTMKLKNGATMVNAELVKNERADAELPEVVDTPQVDTAVPEIPKQADAPAIETDTPGVYTGPTAESYAGAPKDLTDKARQEYVAQIAHEHRVDDLADELLKDKSKYSGYDGWGKSREDARAQLANEAPPESDFDAALDKLHAALPNYKVYDQVRRRLSLEAGVEVRISKFVKKNGLGELTPEVKADLTKRMKEAFSGKKVAVRVSPKTVEHILNDGRIKSQFESNKSSGKKDVDVRASIERTLFGIDDKPWQNAEKRPIYGYVAMDGIRPAGIGSAQLSDPSTDALSQYGQVQVVLKDSVRDRTTAMFGDSMNNMQEAIPTPINNPDWRSFQASHGGITGKGLEGLDRSGHGQDFRAGAYAEAQIHGGVGIDDIEEIVFPSNPTATVKKQLEDAGIPYRVLTFKTAADGSDEDRANALRIAQQDKPFLEGEIAKLQAKLADPKYGGDSYYKKDLAKYEKQLKTINDALPLLEGTKTSPAKKVAAAKEKIAKATTPKQADAPKIESVPDAPKSTGTKLSAAEEQELTSLQASLADLYGQSGYARMREAEITHKSNGGILTDQDMKDSAAARAELKKLRDAATPLAERELELRMKRDGDVFGDVEDVNAERWASKAKPSTVMLPGNDKDKIDKIADSYRINDKATTEHNMSLRSDEPTQAAVSWRSRMKRMINSQQLSQDAVVYRGAALTPERIAQLRPGAVMIDPGSMSSADTRGDAAFYMGVRLGDLPGTIGTMFEIRAPKGMPVADVEYGEFVFDFYTPMRIVSAKRDEHGIINVVAELVPPTEAKTLYGAPPTPKAAKPSGVNLNTGKKGSINAKDAKRYQYYFAQAGLQPNSPPQAIYDKAKKDAYMNNRSVMQILEAIDAIKPGYKKTVLDWAKTPEGSEYISKKSSTPW